MIKYNVYHHLNGLFYRVRLDMSLNRPVEFSMDWRRWVRSEFTLGWYISCDNTKLVARNVVFKDSVC